MNTAQIAENHAKPAYLAPTREGKHRVMLNLYEWTHRHFPNLIDCRPIYVRHALETAGFTIKEANVESMWAPFEIVLGVKDG